jgi:heptosyltransferase III
MVPDAVNLALVERALVIKLRHHGDVLLSSPVFQVLKDRAPHIQIDALVYQDTAPMLAGHPAIREVRTISRDWKKLGLMKQAYHELGLFRSLRDERYDLLIHLTEHNRGAWFARFLKPRYSVAMQRDGLFWHRNFTHQFGVQYHHPRHTVEHNLDALRRIGIYPEVDERRLIMKPASDVVAKVDALLASSIIQGKFIVIHPTSRWLFKAWSETEVAKLIDMLQARGHQLVITAAPAQREKAMVTRILDQVDNRKSLVNLAGQLSLPELAAVIGKAQAFIGVDSAPMHIAASQQTPVVVLFGPSDEQLWGPWQTPNRIVTSKLPEHSCRPCLMDGCGSGKVSDCLMTIPAARVLAALDDLMREVSADSASRLAKAMPIHEV